MATDRSKRIPNKSQVTRNVAGNSSASIGGVRKQSHNTDIPDPTGLDDTKAMAGRFGGNSIRNAEERALPGKPKRGSSGVEATVYNGVLTVGQYNLGIGLRGFSLGAEFGNIQPRQIGFYSLTDFTATDSGNFYAKAQPGGKPPPDSILVTIEGYSGNDITAAWNAGAGQYQTTGELALYTYLDGLIGSTLDVIINPIFA